MANRQKRNDSWMDIWSWVHFATGLAMGWIMEPFWALFLMVLWEPLEIFILSPIAWRLWQVEFGFEAFRNSVSDIVFDAGGVLLGAFVLRLLVAPPVILFD